MACANCDVKLYVKVIKYLKSIAAPNAPAEALRQQLEDLTGEAYVQINNNFCPCCGEKIDRKDEQSG